MLLEVGVGGERLLADGAHEGLDFLVNLEKSMKLTLEGSNKRRHGINQVAQASSSFSTRANLDKF